VPEGLPRLLTIMGSGETAPTMVKVHRAVKERLGDGATGLLLDTPYGFQRNADDLSSRAVAYFAESVRMVMTPAEVRSAADLEGPKGAALTARVAGAPLLFSGPGSPTYALRQWEGTLVPGLMSEKLALGGAVTFASAAALTLGLLTIPVYEIYKVGEDPHWVEGLDLLSSLGIPVVVIPHYDNAEGGTHDTRFCYLGEERLVYLEKEIPEGNFVLGVDEHTAVSFDLDTGEATVAGRGGITVRVEGRSRRIESGEVLRTARLIEIASELAQGAPSSSTSTPVGDVAQIGRVDPAPRAEGTPLLEAIREQESRFKVALGSGDVPGMVTAALDLNDELWAWVADPNQSDELDRGKAALRGMVVELGELATGGTRNPAEIFGPFVDLIVENRRLARDEKRFAESDSIRDALSSLGVEIHDSPEGSTWEFTAPNARRGAERS
jgi:hypothetical protein